MDINKGTDLAALHAAIVSVSAAAFPGVHFEFYRDDRTDLAFGDGAPGNDPRAYALLELSEFEPADSDPGTQQQAMTAKFEAHFILKDVPMDKRLEARVLAGSFAAFLRSQGRFNGSQVVQGPAMVTGCYQDDFNPRMDQYQVWRVEWQQSVFLGAGVWGPGAPAPKHVLVSYEPLVGVPFEPFYRDATGEPR